MSVEDNEFEVEEWYKKQLELGLNREKRYLEELKLVLQERDQLQKFKDWVHNYLDNQGVPEVINGPHYAEGCRVGDRLDWLVNKLQTKDK